MVGGWVAGDFFKLFYFLFNMIGGADNGNNVFALGCLVAISLDSIVAIQMVQSQPIALEWQRRILRAVRHWKTNKDDDAGESRLLNNSGQKKDGLFASILRTCFQWARGGGLDHLQMLHDKRTPYMLYYLAKYNRRYFAIALTNIMQEKLLV